MQGYIKLHRSLLENSIFNSEPFTRGQAWIAILLLTNHKEGFVQIKNGELIKIERGECGYSELALADIFKWSRGKVKRFLTLLEKEKMIQQKNRSNRNIIKVLNYENYQNSTVNDTVNSTVNDTVNSTVNGHLTVQQTDINNNDNNDNNVKNDNKPSKKEIEVYCKIVAKKIDIDSFMAYYEASNWEDKNGLPVNWKQKIISWSMKQKEEPKIEEPNNFYRVVR